MPRHHACHVEDPSARGRELQASMIGHCIVHRQRIEASLVALQPWWAGIEASLSWR
jgi:hypothetical protein